MVIIAMLLFQHMALYVPLVSQMNAVENDTHRYSIF